MAYDNNNQIENFQIKKPKNFYDHKLDITDLIFYNKYLLSSQ